MTMLNEALTYAMRGFYVFPCREKPGAPFMRNGEDVIPREKTPYVSNGLLDATRDEDQIRAWWGKWENAMIGVNAGMSGLFVVDIDRKNVNGLDTFSSWDINDVAGLHSTTPSGGMHIIFTGTGKTSTNAKTGIDTRGDGGYFIVPPSVILEGSYCGEYKKMGDWSKDPGLIPDGLMSKLFPDETKEYVRGNVVYFEGEKRQLSRATLTFLADGAVEGERNSTLFKVLADFAGCGYTKESTRDAVMPVCTRIGLSGGEFETVLEHAYSKPRTPSIPDSIQLKLMEGGKNLASKITPEEHAIIEKVLIACLIVDNSLIPRVNDIVYSDDFKIIKNRIIFKSINNLYKARLKIDYITLSEEVSRENSNIEIDDISEILGQYFVDTENAISYAKIIKDKSSIRKLEAVLDNKEKYLKLGLDNAVASLETDISDIAIEGGVKSTNVLTGEQASELSTERTKKLMSGEIQLLKTGFAVFDDKVGGLYPEEFMICAGRPGSGKSCLSLGIAKHVSIDNPKKTLFFTLEMTTHETVCRLVTQMTGIPYEKVYTGKMDEPQWLEYEKAHARISAGGILFDDSANTIPEIRLKIRKAIDDGLDLVIIDQLEMIQGRSSMPAYLRLDSISYEVRDMSLDFSIPIILNHQQNRGVTDRKLKNPDPILADLNQAGEKPATQVWFIQHQLDKDGKIIQSRIVMGKNRNGPKINFLVQFVENRMLFGNPARDTDQWKGLESHEDDTNEEWWKEED